MTPFDIYLWQQADSFKDLFKPFAFFGWVSLVFLAIASIVHMAYSNIEEVEDDAFLKSVKKVQIGLILTALIGIGLGILATLIPSSKTIAMMVAIPAIANSEPIQKDLPELYQMAKEAIKEQLLPKK